MSRLLLPIDHGPRAVDEPARAALLHDLRRLPRRAQQVFLLNRLDQLTFAQIAERLNLPLTRVEQLMIEALHSTSAKPLAVNAQATRWYIRLQSPAATACERIDFRRWLDASPVHLQAFHATELHWRSLLAPARELGDQGWYRTGRAAFSLGGCSLALGLGAAALLAFGLWSSGV
ncbi:DUF4880 domain-containing protein [Pseudomonas cremoricolorata]|uniref:Sigma-70 protein n=1 Tax=Pseudomonas cremoricolorata TaxID=157783 RepID=A0A089WXF9_9PSED|nr:DUF4880 domain-containing protein [Pseudomonas cremoricolorata]AIR91322.1 sigma-70 protein [Pseudomonas cremoricolorata]